MSGKIYIFSGKIGSGKTTLLERWTEKNSNIGGFLSVKIQGKRHFKNLDSGEIRLMETENEGLEIGNFKFDTSVFTWAEQEIHRQYHTRKNAIIIDEIGPLEVRKEKGFHELLLKLFSEHSSEKPDLIIVVRDFLVQEFLEKYDLKNVKILPKTWFKNQNLDPLIGIVLCGGASKRMKTDKALLKINGVEQWKNSQKILNPFCEKTIISINKEQQKTWAKNEKGTFLIDEEIYQNNGPLSGLLTVANIEKQYGFFVLGIDYPFVKTEHLVQLFNARSTDYEAVCFENNGFAEPLISIFEPQSIPKLKSYFDEGGNSISHFLKLIKTKKLKTENTDFLKNINTPEDFANFIQNKMLD